jgi:hypothetical protein
MSIYLDLIEQFSENIIKQLFMISSGGKVKESFQDDSQKIIENLKMILVKLKEEKSENVKLEDTLRELDSELFKIQLQHDELDKKYQQILKNKNELQLEIDKFNSSSKTTEQTINEETETLKKLKSELESLDSSISAKESEKGALENKKKINEEKKKEALLTHSNEIESFKAENKRKMEENDNEIEKKISEFKEKCLNKTEELKKQFDDYQNKNFFKLFLIDHSDENIPEFEIINILMENQVCDLDELKSFIDLPPILALRTIKQMEAKKIIQVDEETNTVSLSGEELNK